MAVSHDAAPSPKEDEKKDETTDYTDYTDFFVFSSCNFMLHCNFVANFLVIFTAVS